MVETSTTGSGQWASFLPQKHSFTGTITGAVNLDTPGMLNLADLRAKQIAMTLLQCRFVRQDEQGNNYTDTCYFYITSSTDNGDLGNVASFNLSLQGTGALQQSFIPTPLLLSAVKRYQSAAIGGEMAITIPSLAIVDVLDVHKDGIGNCAIIYSGVPASKEVLYDSATGTFTWAIPFEPNETFYILYQSV